MAEPTLTQTQPLPQALDGAGQPTSVDPAASPTLGGNPTPNSPTDPNVADPNAAGNNSPKTDSSRAAVPPSSTSEPGSLSNSTSTSLSTPPSADSTTSSLQKISIPSSTSVASASSTADVHQASSGLSDGGLAGAIVGSIAGTFLLTLLGAILFFRRGQKRKPRAEKTRVTTSGSIKGQGQVSSQPTHTSVRSAKETPSAQSVPVGALYLDLSSYVPQPADDGTTASRIQTLFDQASLHVDNYYSASPSRLQLSQGQALSSIEHYDSAFLPAPLAVMLSKPRAGRPVLTHVLMRALLQGIQPGLQTESLLPAPYASGLRAHKDNDDDRPMFAWRMLTAYIHRTGRSAADPTALIPPHDVIESLAERFSTTFASYGNSQFSDSDRLAGLTSVFRAASELGAWLFAQPCGFDFRWDTGSNAPDHVTVFPAVVKVSDEFGRRLSAPQILVERSVVRIKSNVGF